MFLLNFLNQQNYLWKKHYIQYQVAIKDMKLTEMDAVLVLTEIIRTSADRDYVFHADQIQTQRKRTVLMCRNAVRTSVNLYAR